MKTSLTHDVLKEWLNYSPDTGLFVWKKDSQRRRHTGSVAGYKPHKNRIYISVAGELHSAHRLAWFYVYGVWPVHSIDHINRDSSDNRISNLGQATASDNNRNRTVQSNSKSGIKGVCFHKKTNRWIAQYNLDGRPKHLGFFDSKEAAAERYRSFVEDRGFPFDPPVEFCDPARLATEKQIHHLPAEVIFVVTER